jgi:hypothetical protein
MSSDFAAKRQAQKDINISLYDGIFVIIAAFLPVWRSVRDAFIAGVGW